MVSAADADGDGISDVHESRSTNRDTDADGTPDYLDDDSDGDGLLDADEAGDSDPATSPRDSDGDTVADFVDTDSDDNGISDRDEAPGDVDTDGRPDYADLDDDGDSLSDARELRGELDPPVDTDGDGTPDFHDPDSDGDTILDGQDGDGDTDGDTTLDFRDLDSDDDSITDAIEAGDSDLTTPPADTDDDGTPDFRDPDSDADGLSDRDEVTTHHTSPTETDSDGDGVGDLIEVAAGTDPNVSTDSPRTRGDFVFTVPYMAAPDPTRDTLSFRTSIQFADIYFSFDVTGSMGEELAAMRNTTTGVPAIIEQLRCVSTGGACANDGDCADGVCFEGACIADPAEGAGCIPNLWTGASAWWDRDTFRNLAVLGPDPIATANAVPCPSSSSNLYGGVDCDDGPGSNEAPFQPPYCVADRAICGSMCATTGIGCGGFRPEAIRIYIQVTDADNQCSGSGCNNWTAAGAGAALSAQNIRFISLYGTDDGDGTGTPQSVAAAIGTASGTVDMVGNPFVYLARDSAVVSQTVAAVRAIARGVPLRVTIDAEDEPEDAGDALQFIDRLETNTTGTECAAIATEDTNGDGVQDAFPTVTPGTRVCWDVVPRMNTTVMPALAPQVFRARLTVRGDGSPVDSRRVFFLVPPRPPEIDGPT